METPHTNISTGTIVNGRYQLLKDLGSGGMGQVIQARDRLLRDGEVVLKFMHPHLQKDEISFARFQNEILLMRELTHSNIVRTYDFGQDENGNFFISMEYVDGPSLLEFIDDTSDNNSRFERILKVLHSVACGMAYAHSRGVIHRDLKPENILISNEGEAKIVDFGLARNFLQKHSLTTSGHSVGTPSYMSPEQLRGETLDPRCDIYSFGIIAYELATKEVPFSANNYLELAHLHLEASLPKLNEKSEQIPSWYEDFLEQCCAKEANNRYQTFDEIAEILKTRSTGDMRLLEASMRKSTRRQKSPASLQFTKRNCVFVLFIVLSSILPLLAVASLVFDWPLLGTLANRFSEHSTFQSETDAIASSTITPLAPTKVPGMLSWFEANSLPNSKGDKVSNWGNSAKNSIAAIQPNSNNQPILRQNALNGRQVLRFDGIDDFMTADGLARAMRGATSLTVLYVADATGMSPSNNYIWSVHGKHLYTDIARVGFAPGRRPLAVAGSGTTDKPWRKFTRLTSHSVRAKPHRFHVFCAIFGTANAELYMDGVKLVSANIPRPIDFPKATRFSLGQEWDLEGPSDFFSGNLAELIVYTRTLSETEREGIEEYLIDKYSLSR